MAYKEIDESNITLIDSVSSFIKKIKHVKETKEAQDGTSTELYFRGQETEFWDIEPSIFRDDMLSIEHKLMQIPLQKSPTEFRDLKSMFDIMTKYQHYGMCTRLLDLTTNPLVALYFACKKHGAVKYVTEDGEVEKEPYGVIYYTDKYYSSQSTDIEIQIVSALASYDLEKENTLSDVLERLYHDRIIYNTDKYQEHRVNWWDAVDVISSSGYYPYGDWENQLDRIETVVNRFQKPFFFAETGCMSVKGSKEVPNDWCVRGDADPKGQAEWYEDMFTACSKRDWVGGMALWSWDAKLYQERSAKTRMDYEIYAKPAEKVVKKYYDIFNK